MKIETFEMERMQCMFERDVEKSLKGLARAEDLMHTLK